MEPSPDGDLPPGPGSPSAPTVPRAPQAAPFAGAPGAAAWPVAERVAYGPPPRPDRTPAVWVAVAAAALTSVATFTVCVLLVVLAPPPEQPQPAPAAADPARHTSDGFSARPAAVEVDVTDHPAYELPAPEPVECSPPELDPDSADSWRAFNGTLSECLGELWRPRLEELGLRAVEPEFRVTRTNPDAGSGEEGMTLAYYEGEPMAVTVVLPNVTELSGQVPRADQRGVWSQLLAHEYGHHVQQLAGILDVSYALEHEAPDEEARMEALRRTELQAECLSGVAMRGLDVGDAEIDRVGGFIGSGNDLDTHGSGGNRRHWFDSGAHQDTLGACNTYAAPDSEIR
ncbi:neutral zinc metallopeptidase [Streptomonospora wellingtoniae]|uniref:Neutral zinc metallopeptidase n=1 Tax=Streptomonospora wellingtoniae TaxID=3075544 RepID=A0ABU2KUV8_9ACTN|nr:neutral zinc metallopeptidase [Streptomonospora sp. DSM 45055]MDT0302843.1 neutral zinc metallopeptidase [Streptomonospora sp. DSM 45055]